MRHLHFALREDAEVVAGLAFLHQRLAGGGVAPGGDARHFPQLGVGEVLEERQPAQRLEAVRVGELLRAARAEVLGAESRCEVGGEIVPLRVALGEVLGHRTLHDRLHRGGDPGPEGGRGLGVGIGDLVDERVVVRPQERQPAREQVVHDHAHRVDVGAVVERQVLHLLGRHVRGRADAGHLRGLARGDQRGAEVADFHVGLAGVQDVGGLDIAVRDSVFVREFERARALEDDLDRALDREQRLRATVLLERAAVDVFHHEVVQGLVGDGVVDLADMGVLQLAGELRLGEEELAVHLAARGVDQCLGKRHLDRDVAQVERVVAEVHLGGRALAQLAHHRVFPDLGKARARAHARRRLRARASALRTSAGAVPPV